MPNNFIYYKKLISRKLSYNRVIYIYLLEFSTYNYNLLEILLEFIIIIVLDNASAVCYLII